LVTGIGEDPDTDRVVEPVPNIWQIPLDAALLAQAGGHPRGTLVDVNGRRMRIIQPISGPVGPPVAYDVKPADAPVSLLNVERCDAAACQLVLPSGV
jgi:hypothetical protein